MTNVKAAYKNAMASNLACELVPDFNKEAHPVLYAKAASSLDSMSGRVALERLNQVAYPRRMPIGSGNSLRWNRWARFYRDYSNAPNVNAAVQMFVGDINDYKEQFDAYLDDGETIASFDIQVDTGLRLVSSSIDGDDILYRIEAVSQDNEFNRFPSQVTIIITTSSGRVKTSRIFFGINAARPTTA